MDKHECSPENASQLLGWIKYRGGVAVWRSINLSNSGASWSTPARTIEGAPMGKPNWQAASEPERIITDPSEIEVVFRKEVRRFRITLSESRSGLALKLTNASTHKLNEALVVAGKEASYAFDYDTQEAIILVPDKKVPLSEWG